MKKIVVTQDVGLTQHQKQQLNSLGEVIYFDTTPISQQERLDRVQGADIIYSEEAFMHENLPYIQECFLTFPFTGFLQPVDTDILKQHNVLTSSAQGGNKYAVAERNITAMLYLTRHIYALQHYIQKQSRDMISTISGVRNKKVLILGKGHIGSVTGEMCVGLGMEVEYFLRGDDLASKGIGIDVVINCLRHNESTHNLINAENFSNFRGYYITSTRKEIEDTEFLFNQLSQGLIKGYASDLASLPGNCGNNSDFIALSKSLSIYNTFITPHIAWSTSNAIEYSNDVCIENIKAYISGNPINLLY